MKWDDLSLDWKMRYGNYWEARGTPYSHGQRHFWHEKVKFTPLTETLNFAGVMGFDYDGHDVGTPVTRGHKPTARYDRYYKKRFPWRRWNRGSIIALCRRGYKARAIF